MALENVGVCYRRKHIGITNRATEFWALQDVSLSVYPGETLGVIGRNGAGKTTLLRLMSGILHPDRGNMTTADCKISLLSLQVGFAPHLSGRKNIVLSGLLLGMSRKEIEAKMAAIVAFAELEEFIDEPVNIYSSGMRARLGFSTAFQIEPDILLIDEVLGVGDEEFVKKSSTAMRERIKSNKTVILVTHNQQSIRELCDRAVLIEKGRSVLESDPESVLSAYQQSQKGK